MAREIDQLVASSSIRRLSSDHDGTAGRIRACIAESMCCSVHRVE